MSNQNQIVNLIFIFECSSNVFEYFREYTSNLLTFNVFVTKQKKS